jgi:hypothetical protein
MLLRRGVRAWDLALDDLASDTAERSAAGTPASFAAYKTQRQPRPKLAGNSTTQ